MRRVAIGLAALLAAATLDAQPRPVAGAATHASATVHPVAVSATSATLLVTLAVEEGWHVSWRNPGETGLPTRFVWNLPSDVRVRRETWPVPLITRGDVGVAHTLEGEIPWLFEFAVGTPSAADRLVSLTLRYGVCRDVCIPAQLTVQGVLPGTGAGASPLAPVPTPLRARLAIDAAVIPARRQGGTMLCLDRLPAGLTGAVGLQLIAAPDRDLDAALAVTRGTRGEGRVTLPASTQLRQPVDTVLLVSGQRGITLPLDFRAPASRCR